MKLKTQYGDDVNVLMVESQQASPEQMEAFALKQKWLAVGGIWTTERPFDFNGNGLPHTTVLGIDGAVLFDGSPTGAIEDLVGEQVKLAKKGPKDLPPSCAKAWADFEKGNWAAAIKALDAVPDGAEKDAATKLSKSLSA